MSTAYPFFWNIELLEILIEKLTIKSFYKFLVTVHITFICMSYKTKNCKVEWRVSSIDSAGAIGAMIEVKCSFIDFNDCSIFYIGDCCYVVSVTVCNRKGYPFCFSANNRFLLSTEKILTVTMSTSKSTSNCHYFTKLFSLCQMTSNF